MEDKKKEVEQEQEELENKDSSKRVLLGIFATMMLLIAVVGVSFAMLFFSMKLSDQNSITTGTISMAFQDTTYIDIVNAYPMTDEEGKAMSKDKEYMDFSVSASFSGKSSIYYEISAVDETRTTEYKKVPYENLKIYLEEKGKESSATPVLYSELGRPTLHNDVNGLARQKDKLLATGVLSADRYGGTVRKNYRLRMWIDENTEDISEPMTFKLKVRLDAVQQKNN